jgi:hypothetical protein
MSRLHSRAQMARGSNDIQGMNDRRNDGNSTGPDPHNLCRILCRDASDGHER